MPKPKKRRVRCLRAWASVLAGKCPKDFYGPGLVPVPTVSVPGGQEKVEVMRGRYSHCEQIFHPGDAPLPENVGWIGRLDNFLNAYRLEMARQTCRGVEKAA